MGREALRDHWPPLTSQVHELSVPGESDRAGNRTRARAAPERAAHRSCRRTERPGGTAKIGAVLPDLTGDAAVRLREALLRAGYTAAGAAATFALNDLDVELLGGPWFDPALPAVRELVQHGLLLPAGGVA